LQAAGLPAVCIETRRVKGATAVMAVKTDRNDARAIAQAMRVGWFTTVHVKTAESQELRLLRGSAPSQLLPLRRRSITRRGSPDRVMSARISG